MAKIYGALEKAQFEWFDNAGRPAAASFPYRVIWNTDSNEVQVSDGAIWISPASSTGIQPWSAVTTYNIGDIVTDSVGGVYYSKTNGNLNNAVTDPVNWQITFNADNTGHIILTSTTIQDQLDQADVSLDSLVTPVRSQIKLTGAPVPPGYGSVNTCIRRFLNTVENIGSAITYTDSATLGGSFTINERGVYSITRMDQNFTAAGNNIGISLNSTQLTTSITSITNADRLGLVGINALSDPAIVTITIGLDSGDVIRAHDSVSGSADAQANANCYFTICKVSN